MTDPLRKTRKLRFRFSRALVVSAPLLVGSAACGEPAPAVNTVAPEPEERTNVGGRGESDEQPPEEQPPVEEERPDDNVNVVENPPPGDPEPLRPPERTNVTEEEAP